MCAWAAGTYTKWNGAGGSTADASGGIGIEAGRHDTQDTDFQNGINNCLTKDGQNTPTANLPMGGFKHTNVADATLSNQYMAFGQISNGTTTVNVGPITGVGTASINGTSVTSVVSTRYSNDAAPGGFTAQHSRGATIGSHVVVQANDVVGRIDFNGSDGATFRTAARIDCHIDGTAAASDMPGRLVFSTTADGGISCPERLRIDNAGRIAANAVPASPSQFDITSTTATRRALTVYQGVSDLSTPALGVSKFNNDSTTSNRFIVFYINDGAATSGGIAANGASQAAFVSVSDERLKENIVDLPSQLVNVMSLRPVEYDYKDGSGHQIGFIAQEVRNIYPDLVAEDDQGILNLSGLGKNEARLIKAFQEFASIVEQRIVTLEAKVAALENA